MGDGEAEDLEQLYLEALASPMRREILRRALDTEEAISPGRISKKLGQDLPKVSYHVRVLADHGLMTLAFTKRVRGTIAHFYVVDRSALEHPIVKAWLCR